LLFNPFYISDNLKNAIKKDLSILGDPRIVILKDVSEEMLSLKAMLRHREKKLDEILPTYEKTVTRNVLKKNKEHLKPYSKSLNLFLRDFFQHTVNNDLPPYVKFHALGGFCERFIKALPRDLRPIMKRGRPRKINASWVKAKAYNFKVPREIIIEQWQDFNSDGLTP
jgi:hypothetical protein